MVLIPNDAGIRMRMQTEASLIPVTPVKEIPADLLEFRPGTAFSARIQEVLPENTFKALVAGRSLTLALPQGATVGDTLELVVVDRTPRLIVAQLANRDTAGEAPTGSTDRFTNLSPTARLIGALLARDGAPPAPAELNRGQAMVTAAPGDTGKLAAELAPQLAKAVSQSGLFYEAHQVQWIMGQRPLSDLLTEPQAKFAAPATPTPSGPEAALSGTRASPAASLADETTRAGALPVPAERPAAPAGAMVILQNLFGGEDTRQQPVSQLPAVASPAQAVPEELRPLVQQQLDAAATQRLAWHGEVWPGQSLKWQIEPDDRRAGADPATTERDWITSLHMVTPRLGEIDARLSLTPQGVRIAIATPTDESAADLRSSAPTLEKSMAAAGVPLLALQVKHVNAG